MLVWHHKAFNEIYWFIFYTIWVEWTCFRVANPYGVRQRLYGSQGVIPIFPVKASF